MKKRLLTAWLIACMMISLVGQTPITALAEGDDSRVISMSEGLQEVLLNDVSETPVTEDENTVVEIPEAQTEQSEDAIVEDTPGIELVQNENTIEDTPGIELVQDENTVEDTPGIELVQEENTVEDTPGIELVQNENTVEDTPGIELVQNDNIVEDTPGIELVQNENTVEDTPAIELVQNENTVEDTPGIELVQNDNIVEDTLGIELVQNDNTVVETPELVEKIVDANLPQGTHNLGDIVRVSGLLPKDSIVEAIPVNVEIEGQDVLLAYDITIYENEEKKNAGISWQPGENGLSVEFISSALETTEEEVNIWHMEDTEETPEYVTAAPSPYGSVEFVAESFSVYVVTSTKLTATIVASDGNTYEINVTYTNQSGIPMDGTKLAVSELKSGDERYDEYIEESASKVGTKAEDFEFSKVFDIKIVDENDEAIEYEPTGDVDVSIRVIGVSLSEYPQVNVLHFVEDRNDENFLIYDIDSTVNGETVEFTTDSFSVYVVVGHEGGEVVTPRVEFHFIDRLSDSDYLNGVSSPFTAAPYNFVNTAGEYQTTQILKAGESLSRINNPRNIKIENPNGSNIEKFFYGWYVVNMSSDSTHRETLNAGTAEEIQKYVGNIVYTWPDEKKVEFDTTLSFIDGTYKVGDEIEWTLGNVSGKGVLDEDGTVDVYLAPLFQDFYFVNFRMGARNADLSNNLLTRKLIVFGEQSSATVRIGDVECPSADPQHKIFVGWETVNDNGGNLERDIYFNTIDYDGNEIIKTVDASGNEIASVGNGYYITVSKTASEFDEVNLYPVFAEARWLYFSRGAAGNGSSYVGAAYRVTNDENVGTYFDNDFFNGTNGNASHLSRRPGYSLEGWYAFAVTDSEGNITNLTTPADVSINYIDSTGVTQTTTINTTAVKIVDVDNSGSEPVGNISYNGAYTVNGVKLFEVQGGKMYVYRAMDDLTLYANWVKDTKTSIRVIVWKQKVTDDKYATDAEKTYDYEIFYTDENASTTVIPDLTGFSGTYVDSNGVTQTVSNKNLLNESFTGFHYSRNDVATVGAPEADGTTVYNVYYDRDLLTMTFNRYTTSGYAETTSNSGTQYAFIGDEWIQLTYSNGEWTIPVYSDIYTESTGMEDEMYGLVNGEYVLLTPQVSEVIYKSTSALTDGKKYLIVNSNSSGNNRYALRYSSQNGGTDQVTINSATGNIDSLWISASEVEATSIWTVKALNNGYTFQNGSAYLRRNNGNLRIEANSTNNIWTWNATNNRLSNGNYYLRYNNGFSLNTTTNSIYLFVQTNIISGYTYNGVDYNGTRYIKSLEVTDYKAYNGKRYTASSGNNAWRVYKAFDGLFGQTLEHNGCSWPTEYSWYDTGSNTGGTSGTRTTFLDAFTGGSEIFYAGNVTTGNYTYNHYKQNVDGSWPAIDEWANQTSTSGGGYWSFTEKYDGFTVSYYYIGNRNNAISNWNNTWTSTSAGQQTPNFTNNLYVRYARQTFDLTFDVNYPVDASLNYSNGKSSNITVNGIYYQASLSQYSTYYGVDSDSINYTNDLKSPDHYIFGGWYEDASCTVPFNFNSTMPVGNKIVYAKWTPERFIIKIDPNGGEIDHVNHNGYSSFGSGTVTIGGQSETYDFTTINSSYSDYPISGSSNYNESFQTYIRSSYGTTLTIYEPARRFVPMSDSVAEQYANEGNDIYYYVNYQWRETDGASGIYNDIRSALYLTESDLLDFYELYKNITIYSVGRFASSNEGMTTLDYNTWKQLYVSQTKYRPLFLNEHWTFLGWYKVDNGVMEDMPYNDADPVNGEFTLKAMWRLDGSYKVQYIAEYSMEDGASINGGMEKWTDPTATNVAYSDGATTTIYKAPTDLTKNGTVVNDDTIIFKGFRLVYNAGTAQNPNWQPMEVDGEGNVTTYYYPGDDYTIHAGNAYGSDGIIYLQAVYQYKNSSDHRPVVTNLTIDANSGYVNITDDNDLPEWNIYPGTNSLNDDPGKMLNVNGTDYPTQILFGDIQSEAAVHLYQFASEITQDAQGNALFDANQLFTHPNGYFLLGFDDVEDEYDYIATYAADSVIAVTPDVNKSIFAVWEPMVYVTFKNNTPGTITFGLSSTDGALEVSNVKKGLYIREPLTNLGEITLKSTSDPTYQEGDDVITLAFPKGAEKDITVSGTNNLGPGKVLVWNSSIELSDRVYSSDNTPSPDTSYSHTVGNDTHSHELPSGEANNLKTFSFTETPIANSEPLTVTFTHYDKEYALLLNDNWNGDGTGGGIQETDFGPDDIKPDDSVNPPEKKGWDLPGTSTRFGYSFLGWAYSASATSPDFYMPNGRIEDLNKVDGGFFSENTVEIEGVITRTLYGVWEPLKDAVYVYKDVPEPGNQDKPFEFTVKISGTYHVGSTNYQIKDENNNDLAKSFSIKHGEYLRIVTTTDYGVTSGHNTAYVQAEVEVYSPVTTNGTLEYVKDDNRSKTISWQKTVTPNSTNGFNTDLKFEVYETQVNNYNTSVTLNYSDGDNKLTIGSNTYAASQLPQEVNTNTVSWKDPDVRGTVTFNNVIDKYNVSVEKRLVTNKTGNEDFPFTASYVLDESESYEQTVSLFTATDNFLVTSGNTNNEALKEIPAGAKLTITELDDDEYTTRYSTDDGANWTEGREVVLTVDSDKKVIYENTLKSYPVTFKLVDQNDVPLHAMFSLASTVGIISSDLYAGQEGKFYTTDKFWCDTYTLNQTTTADGYISLQGTPITITVKGGTPYIESDNSWVTVTPNDANDPEQGFVITVKNWAQKTVTVKKVLEDPLLTGNRTFNFSYSYTSPLDSSQVSKTFTLQPTANNPAGASRDLIIPANATNLVIMELTTGENANITNTYDIKVELDTNGAVDGTSQTEWGDDVSDLTKIKNDHTVIFTNTRKEIEITLIKRVDGKGGSFDFNTTVKNGGNILTGYGTSGTPINGFVAGLQTINLNPATFNEASTTFKIPYGAVLEISEVAMQNYIATAEGRNSSSSVGTYDSDNLTIVLDETQTIEDLTITFTNTEVQVAPSSYDEKSAPYMWIFLLSMLLTLGIAVPTIYRIKIRIEQE